MATAAIIDEADNVAPDDGGSLRLLAEIAQTDGDISHLLEDADLARIGVQVVEDYERDCMARQAWETTVEKALKRAAQEHSTPQNPPNYRRSHIDFPLLTVAAQQFNARAYPAICRPGDMVRVKVIGNDRGRPQLDDQGKPMVVLNGQPMTMQQAAEAIASAPPQAGPDGQPAPQPQPEPAWQIPPGAKQERADRVGSYLSTYIQYRMDDWEADTDLMLMQIPVIGCGFRKLWWQDGQQRAAFVSALDLVVPMTAKTLASAPRITERMNDVYPYQIKERMNSGQYRFVELLPTGDDDEEPRLLLEQHRLLDLDGDGVDEPYIVTVDKETQELLRLEPAFGHDDVILSDDDTRVIRINRPVYYVKYPFLPDPKGGFYDIGFGHLIEQISDVVNAAINQMMDAGHAQIAGGGFIAAGLRLQSNNRSDRILWEPGEYKTVNVTGGDLRAGIVERTFPNVSEITFRIMEMMLGAAKDITSVKDIVTGDAPNTAPVGTTLALIEQGLQVFTAIYKRIYRALGGEYQMIYTNLGTHGDETTAQDYMDVLDDPAADFAKDFSEQDTDIKPVADPTAVTSQQRIAKAQLVQQIAQGNPLIDQKEALTRVFDAAGIENIDQLWAQQTGPDPMTQVKLAVGASTVRLNDAKASQAAATATEKATNVGHRLGESEGASVGGRVSGMAESSGDGMGGGGVPADGGGAAGGMGAGVVAPGGV